MTDISIFLILLGLGYVFGVIAEKKHYRSILRRESETNNVPCMTLKKPPAGLRCKTQLVAGSVVISVDFFKRFLAGLRNLFGGRVKSYETLLDRARREAILRMKEKAIGDGAKVIMNVRIETSSISKSSSRKDSVGSIEVLAYGTAIIPSAS